MHSSISNSDAACARRGIRLFLLLVALGGLVLELSARYGVPLVYHNMRRFQAEFERAVSIRENSTQPLASVLLLGNSMTFTDIDLDQFQKALGPACDVTRWAVDDTNYFDWYFGLRRVFRAGSRPRFVVMGTISGHLVSVKLRGNFFAHYILDRRDVFAAATRTGSDSRSASQMLLAKSSAFYGCRDELYKRVMTMVLPHFEDFARSLTRHMAPVKTTPAGITERVEERLKELRDLCREHGAQLIVWLPPLQQVDTYAPDILAAARQAGIPAFVPLAHDEFDQGLFRDPIHLKREGALLLTPRLAAQLRPFVLGSAKSSGGAP